MNWEMLKGAARHIIGLVGGVLVGVGVATAEEVNTVLGSYEAIIGGVMAVAAFALSALNKIKGIFIKTDTIAPETAKVDVQVDVKQPAAKK